MQTTLTFQRPHVIHPRMRAALDELTASGLLAVTEDRGAMSWAPTASMAPAAMGFKLPSNAEGFPMTVTGEASAQRVPAPWKWSRPRL
jgi:hypothetical protein